MISGRKTAGQSDFFNFNFLHILVLVTDKVHYNLKQTFYADQLKTSFVGVLLKSLQLLLKV